jgi:hypothetical protein
MEFARRRSVFFKLQLVFLVERVVHLHDALEPLEHPLDRVFFFVVVAFEIAHDIFLKIHLFPHHYATGANQLRQLHSEQHL